MDDSVIDFAERFKAFTDSIYEEQRRFVDGLVAAFTAEIETLEKHLCEALDLATKGLAYLDPTTRPEIIAKPFNDEQILRILQLRQFLESRQKAKS